MAASTQHHKLVSTAETLATLLAAMVFFHTPLGNQLIDFLFRTGLEDFVNRFGGKVMFAMIGGVGVTAVLVILTSLFRGSVPRR